MGEVEAKAKKERKAHAIIEARTEE
jgi:hypothetical protein